MDNYASQPVSFVDAAKTGLRRLLAAGENRLELLVVEMQEETERFVWVVFLAIGTAALGLLAAMGFSAAVVVALWDHSHVAVLIILTCAYAIGAVVLGCRLAALCRNQNPFPASIDQLKKDRECLEKTLSS
jgi:uncharacterized membrane protein YqjE